MRGLRRGELTRLPWTDVDFDERIVTITLQRITYGNVATAGPLQTKATMRTVALGRHTVRVLRAHYGLRQRDRLAAGED